MGKYWLQTQKILADLECQLQCSICHKLPVNPHILWCKHSYCKDCISTLKNCPECNILIVNQELVPNIVLMQILSLMKVTSDVIISDESNHDVFSASDHHLNSPKPTNIVSHRTSKQTTTLVEHYNENSIIELKSAQDLKRPLRGRCSSHGEKETSESNSLELNNITLSKSKKRKLNTDTSKKSQKANVVQSFKTPPKHTLFLAKKACESDKVNKKGETPLHIACRQGKLKLVHQLLQESAQPNVKDYANWTPLCDAVSVGKIDIVKALLQAGAAVNTPCHQNTTPLIEAVLKKNKDMVALLLSHGADIHQRTSLDNTAWSLANDEFKSIMENMKNVVIMKHPNIKVTPKIVTVHNISEEYVYKVKSFCETFNLTLSTIFTDETTHLIVEKTADNTCEGTTVILQAILLGCSVVGLDWIEACVQASYFVPVDDFEPCGTNDVPNSSVFSKARQNREQLLPKLFDGCHISLQHGQRWPTSVKEELVTLVRASGAQYLPRECDPERIPLNEETVMFHTTSNTTLAMLSHVILYQSTSSRSHITYNMAHIKSLPISWFKQCIKTFSVYL